MNHSKMRSESAASSVMPQPYAPCPCRKPIDWRLTENRAMLICNEISFQAHCLGGCRSVSVAGSARGRDFNVAATDHCSATNRPQETFGAIDRLVFVGLYRLFPRVLDALAIV